MLRIRAAAMLRGIVLLFLAGAALAMSAQSAPPAGRSGARVLMVTDIHFDPFLDPGKVEKLTAAPAAQWAAILGAAPSQDRQQRAAALQKACQVKGTDTDYTLFESSLRAMRHHAAGARFILVSGDLLAHDFSCKYDAVVPQGGADGQEAFAAKTLEFVLGQIRGAFPGVPVYAALGNNDSGCGDYRIDAGGAFLRAVAPVLSADLPTAERGVARQNIAAVGYYSVALPAPMKRTRLLILDDVFMAPNYATCGAKPDPAPAAEETAWLRRQLAQARREHGKVWVMAHIPPGIDPYSTIRKMANLCAGAAPVTFLNSDALSETIAEYGDVVRLAVFAHTHMDELRLLRARNGGAQEKAVPAKLVPSISPVRGNRPSFVEAGVDSASAALSDYRVIAASNLSGTDTQWRQEYDFDRAYGEKEFSGAGVQRLIAGLRSDTSAISPASSEYLRDYFVGDQSAVLRLFWPEYTCTLENDTAAAFRSCVCRDRQAH